MELSSGKDLGVVCGSESDEAIAGVAMALGSQYNARWKETSKGRGVD